MQRCGAPCWMRRNAWFARRSTGSRKGAARSQQPVVSRRLRTRLARGPRSSLDQISRAAPSPDSKSLIRLAVMPEGVDLNHPITVPDKPALEGLEQKWIARWEAERRYRFDRTRPREAVYS